MAYEQENTCKSIYPEGRTVEKWLRCRVTPGQFETEYAVAATQTNGKIFSLFAPKETVLCDREPAFDQPADGLLHVKIHRQTGDKAVVFLPRPSLEADRFVTVYTNQLQEPEPANGELKK